MFHIFPLRYFKDSGKKNCRKSAVDLTFEKAMEEAEKAYQKLKVDKAARDEEAKMGLVCYTLYFYFRLRNRSFLFVSMFFFFFFIETS